MWQVQGFKTKEQAKKFEKEHGGYLCWEERTPKTKKLTRKGKEYLLAANAIGLDTTKYPYLVEWRI
ncbi:MAG: hypothetical protein IJ657_00435 [Acidaminococcaceae bacterium]|nr:hypothetical protein [Acidaminococcaceae bacterium]